jgi:hypothetical protein
MGSAHVRKALYMPAVVGVRFNPLLIAEVDGQPTAEKQHRQLPLTDHQAIIPLGTIVARIDAKPDRGHEGLL